MTRSRFGYRRALPGQFTGEVNMISGRRALFRARVREAGEVIELNREQTVALVQNDAEISEILMRAFILRRVELVASGMGDAVLVGSVHSSGTLRIKEFLTRNGHPYKYIDLDHDADVQALLDHFHVAAAEVPVLICRGDAVLKNPSNQRIAECLGFNDAVDQTHVRDVVIVGAGPSGLSAAVYGALRRTRRPGAGVERAGRTGGLQLEDRELSRLPFGIRVPEELTGRVRAGAEIRRAGDHRERPHSSRAPEVYAIEIDNGKSRRRAPSSSRRGSNTGGCRSRTSSGSEGMGIYYGATFVEAQVCGGEDVIVVGGGNSAGQAAVFLSQTAKRVQMFVRSDGLAESMSKYLILRIQDNPAIVVRTQTEIVGLEGGDHLERVHRRDNRTGRVETEKIGHVFVMTGAVPNTQWLDGCVALDAKGFIKTGPDLSEDDLAAARWPLPRAPHLLETSLRGVFAVGDVRCGNIKRVASAVGEGSIAVAFVHQVLHE
jgi:thioredoxin reductase (NADPH)